jgi:hypothetical protein
MAILFGAVFSLPNRSNLGKNPVEVVKGRILVGWAQKSPEPKDEIDFKVQEAKKHNATNSRGVAFVKFPPHIEYHF